MASKLANNMRHQKRIGHLHIIYVQLESNSKFIGNNI